MKHFAHLDVNVSTACNYTCASCSHLAPFTKASKLTAEGLERDLAMLKPIVQFKRIQAVGGEPTLFRELVPMLRVMRQSGIAEQVVVITNGSLLHKMGEDFWRAIDVLKLSVYGKLPVDAIVFAEAKAASMRVAFERQDYPDFYKQFSPQKTDGVKSYRDCHWRKDCYTVHAGKFYVCPQSVFFHKMFPDLTAGEDGIDLVDLTEEKLGAFLHRTEPLAACSHCCGGHSVTIPWHEAKSREQWVEDATV